MIKLDLRTHGRQYAPAWKAIEYMSFGTVLSIYDNLLDGGLKRDISVLYGMHSSSQFSNYMHTVRRLRNYCAHGKVLFDLALPVAISAGPLMKMICKDAIVLEKNVPLQMIKCTW